MMLMVKDQQNVVQYKVRKTTPLQKIVVARCKKFGLQASQVHLTAHGMRIAEDDTAEKLRLGDEDIIVLAREVGTSKRARVDGGPPTS